MPPIKRCLTIPYQLYRGPSPVGFAVWTRLEQFRVDIEVCEPSTMEWLGKVNLKNRGVYNGPIGVGIRATLRHSATPFADPPASSVDAAYYTACVPFVTWSGKASNNISSKDDHYSDLTTVGDEDLALPGFYRLEFWGCSHSTGAPTQDGLAVVNVNGDGSDLTSPYSYLIARVRAQ